MTRSARPAPALAKSIPFRPRRSNRRLLPLPLLLCSVLSAASLSFVASKSAKHMLFRREMNTFTSGQRSAMHLGYHISKPLRNALSLASGFLTLTSGTQADSKISFILCIVIISNNTTQIIPFQGRRCNNDAMDSVMNTMLLPFCSDMATAVISNNTPLIFVKETTKASKGF